MLAKYEAQLAASGKMRNHYLRFARDYLESAKSDYSRATVDRYLDRLRRNGYNENSARFVFSILRTLFKRNGLDWPFRRGEGPQVRENEINAPALDPDVIAEMIRAIKLDGERQERFFLALSTTYGVRREELLELASGDVNLGGRTLHIHTRKHGRERTHMIPDEIVPALQGYDFSIVSEFKLLELWYRIEHRIGMSHIDQVGWHSIRRTLNTLLLDKLPETVVMGFLRWKQRTSSIMPYRYSAQRFVGREGTITKVVGEAKDIDTKVFAQHPFIEHWR